ncbi:hypothetical protein [Gracilimonas sp.]|uniref:hypothetical protein n=1 Tax=Gracilimonas sp. TaxID=1974203 RepID=UPI0032ED8BA2
MKFDFNHISFADIQGYSMLKEESSNRSDTERAERIKQAGSLLNTLLTEPDKGLLKKDSVSDFYSDLASPSTQKRNLAINKNTADRHGRT